MPRSELVPLPTAAEKFVSALLAFVITVAVGTSPLWGGGRIAGYQSILDLFPRDLQDVIPWASMLMTVTAVAVQFASGELLPPRRVGQAFAIAFAALIVLVFASYAVYKAFVVRIDVPGAGTKVAYLVGSTPLPNCECAKHGLEIRQCIGVQISVDPDAVSACFPREQISTRGSILSALYMLLMFTLAVLIGLFVLQRPRRAAARSRRQ